VSDADLIALAERAGIAPRWRDAYGQDREVAPDTLRAVLASLDLPAGTDAALAESRDRLREQEGGTALPPLVTATVGRPVTLPVNPGRYRLFLEDGGSAEGEAEARGAGKALLPPVNEPGYHRVEIGGASATLAVAPPRCVALSDLAPGGRLWGLAVQLYSLRRPGDGGIGDFAALRSFVRSAASHGAAAIAISPVHAQFSADPGRSSPYAPSSRSLLNVVHAALPEPEPEDEEETARLESLSLIDWPAATRLRLRGFRRAFARAGWDAPGLAEFRRLHGDLLESHARFEALHGHFFGADPGKWDWRTWPEAFRDPRSPAVDRFAQDHAQEVAFYAWLQFLADQGLRSAQQAAREAGMPVGLIADLAVGTDAGGSHSWSRPDEVLTGLTVGAPPDALGPQGQNWGLVGFSPRGLVQSGFSALLEMLRASLRHAGGVRIDHALGLTRLWVLPEGARASEGAYLHFPETDLLRLIALESWRHQAIVLGEDLGTVPEGFRQRLGEAGVMGLRVLWFERYGTWFSRPSAWTRDAVAMTSTHDVPTVAGWWTGADLDWRASLGLLRDAAEERAGRERDRTALWDAFIDSGAASGGPPPAGEPAPAVDAAVTHVGRAACDLVLLPVEDALGQEEQPNFPGTLDEHPNWRRRLSGTPDALLDEPAVAARLASLAAARKTA
jgi:4-alpha-glucanotransferase